MDYWITNLLHILLIFGSVYPQELFNTMPPPVNTNFTCRGRDIGFYADVETNCRVYHTCDDHGNKFTYYCPEETAFRQEALVCDHAHLVDCKKGEKFAIFAEENAKNKENNDPRSSHAATSLNEARIASGRSIDVFRSGNSNPSYTRSFRITAEPPADFATPKSLNRKQPTFVLNSSVYLRDRVNNEKSSPASQNNRVATESSKNFEKLDNNEREINGEFFGRNYPSSSSTTTFGPFEGRYEKSTKYNNRYFEEKGDNEKISTRFSSVTSTTTFKPFGADFKVNRSDSMDSFSSGFHKKNEKSGFFGRSSTITTTTFKPFTTNFKANPIRQNPGDLSFRNVNKKDESSNRFSSASSSTTFRPFAADISFRGGNKKNEGSDRFSSASSSTTFRPFAMDFNVNPTRQTPSDFSFRGGNKKDDGSDRFSSASSSTTFRPFGADFKARESSDGVGNFGNIKFDSEDRNSGSRMTSASLNHDEMNSPKNFQFEGKRRNEPKSIFGGSSSTEGRNNEGTMNPNQKDLNSRNWQTFGKTNNQRPSFFFDNSNFPYSETLRSMQAKANKSLQPNSSTARPSSMRSTSPRTTTAGTEFPVHPFTGLLSPLVPNDLDDDPYYPRRPTTTEAYYKLNDNDKGGKRPFRFSTRRPWPGSVDFEIPEVLPDFNTLDDLVDRRKLFFIPRVKANN